MEEAHARTHTHTHTPQQTLTQVSAGPWVTTTHHTSNQIRKWTFSCQQHKGRMTHHTQLLTGNKQQSQQEGESGERERMQLHHCITNWCNLMTKTKYITARHLEALSFHANMSLLCWPFIVRKWQYRKGTYWPVNLTHSMDCLELLSTLHHF